MASNVTNRETVRDAFYALLNTALVGEGKPAQVGYNYLKADFQGQSPVFAVSSGGRWPSLEAVQSRAKSEVYINLYLFALYSEQGGAYQEDDAEDALDALEKAAVDVIIDNICVPGSWHQIEYVQPSEPSLIESLGGDTYKREVIQLRFRLSDN